MPLSKLKKNPKNKFSKIFQAKNRPAFLILGLWFLSFLVLLIKTVPVSGDGIYYFAYLRSLFIDHDLNFFNELTHFAGQNIFVAKYLAGGVHTATGLAHNLYSIGPAILWAPFYAVAHLFALAGGQIDGYSHRELLAPSLATSFYGLLGLGLSYSFIKKIFTRTSAAAAVLSIWLGTNLIYYLTFDASLAHGLGFFSVALLLWFWQKWQGKVLTNKNWWRWFLLGLLVGLAGLVRWQLLAVGAVLPGLDLLWRIIKYLYYRKYKLTRANLIKLVLVSFGAVLAFLPQMFAWRVLFGHWLTIPQGRGFVSLASPHFWQVLFSARHGLFVWSPLVALALIGLLLLGLARRGPGTLRRGTEGLGHHFKPQRHKQDGGRLAGKKKRRLSLWFFAIFLVQTYVNGAALEWWGGDAFGPRRFTDISLIFMFGLALLFWWAKKRVSRRVLVAGFVVILMLGNFLLLQAYRLGLLSLNGPLEWSQLLQLFK